VASSPPKPAALQPSLPSFVQLSPTEVASTLAEVAERSTRLVGKLAKKQGATMRSVVKDEFGIGRAFLQLWGRLALSPLKVVRAQANLLRDSGALVGATAKRLLGRETKPVATKSDGRFKDEDWQKLLLFDFLKQSYLIVGQHLQDLVAQDLGLTDEARKKVLFFTRQYVEAMSPANFVLTNPTVLRETLRTGGFNLLKGFNNLLRDLEAGEGSLQVRMTDPDAFKVGVNVATAPGKVVFENQLMQLIQFAPSTEKQFKRPLLIIPPWINKYYILDLRESNSFVRWATAQGHSVFVVSWVNPDAALAQKSFDDYLTEGPLAALDAIEQATGEKEVNTIGYCLGGTLLGATLGYMAAKGDRRIVSSTFFVSLLDFSIPGELGVFIDEKQVSNLEKRMSERGYLEAADMASTFNLLRANDLIWGFVVNNYLLGREPMPFDLLYWNSDSTRMPSVMHSFYLRNMYLKNLLRQPGGISLKGTPIDLSKVTVPAYFVSTADDHIAPWRSTYLGSKALGGPVRFVLGGSGHIAGIVNPPAANKYGFFTNDARPDVPEAWQAGATRHDGSWWLDWQAWVSGQSDAMVPARVPGSGGLPALADAPGRYVATRA
jgi:polyhydroxyalkanoate synthase subunit PhaC